MDLRYGSSFRHGSINTEQGWLKDLLLPLEHLQEGSVFPQIQSQTPKKRSNTLFSPLSIPLNSYSVFSFLKVNCSFFTSYYIIFLTGYIILFFFFSFHFYGFFLSPHLRSLRCSLSFLLISFS